MQWRGDAFYNLRRKELQNQARQRRLNKHMWRVSKTCLYSSTSAPCYTLVLKWGVEVHFWIPYKWFWRETGQTSTKKDTSSAYRSNSIRSQGRWFSQAMPGLSLWLLEGNYPNPYISFIPSISLQQPHFICITSRLLPLLLRLPSMHTTSS